MTVYQTPVGQTYRTLALLEMVLEVWYPIRGGGPWTLSDSISLNDENFFTSAGETNLCKVMIDYYHHHHRRNLRRTERRMSD